MMKTAVALGEIEDAVHSACRAPSFHNSQPWMWVLESTTLRLFLDPDQLVDTDSAGRQALLSCGAALDHLRVVMAARGWEILVDRFPNPNNRHHLADIEFRQSAGITTAQRRDADAVARRRSDRLPYGPVENPAALETLLRLAVEDRPAYVDLLAPQQRDKVAEASHLAEALRMYDTEYHAELAWWTAPFGATTGIPHSALVSAAESDRVETGRTFPVTHTRERRQHAGDDQATIVVISALDDNPRGILACGETLSTVLIEATGAGLASCTLTHVTEHPATRGIIGALTGHPLPQVLVRIGVAPEFDDVPPPTPRRPLSDVFHVRAG
ncbi:NAD(P)H nitroreductase [Mycolicibacterium sp. 141076]|uniref:Acg family FMN-binding oxidoreductase n=1 Tax=unclassified Mycolicibacterium TaxID=2636767 RepID=UPI000FC2F80F|nr:MULTISPECIES: NAD(P)H nitroreductase [unclassified Mycolicibacterium]MDX1877128.1 NAD(P)H nitroreductase [Mycolicibacterium sp. 141076]RUP33841.1 MAG: NAD(P)H nitroreductase [Mycolicibacterium sp.]